MSNPVISQTNTIPANESLLNLSEILKIMRLSWRLISGVVIFSLLISLALAYILPKKWEASATLRIAKTPSETGELKPIEDPLQTVERLKLLGFKQKILESLHLPTKKGKDSRSDLLLGSLRASSIKNTEFITISVSAYSEQDAIKSIQTVIGEIQATHASMTLSMKNRVRKELQDVNEDLSATDSEISTLNNQMSSAGMYKTASEFSPSIVAISLLTAKESTRRALQLQQIQLNDRLSSLDEQSTKLINTIDSSDRPIFPKRSVFLILGGLLGLLFGLGIAISKNKE